MSPPVGLQRGQRGAARPGLIAGLLAVLSVLTGCASIPTTGPVISGRLVESDPRDGVLQVVGEKPVDGASPADIVSGFLRNAAGFGEDHQQARRFLAPARRLAWRPDAAVKIYRQYSLSVKENAPAATVAEDGSGTETATPTPTPGAGSGASADVRDRTPTTKVTVKTSVIASIDVDGRYRQAPPGETLTASFGLVRIGGEWRISALADGILIGDNDFGITFRPFPVYFADPTGRYLVPDVHWFPAQDRLGSPELPTALVRVLLQGPPPWLKGAVTTGAPEGTAMAVAAVVVSGDKATVDLTNQVRNTDARQRQMLAGQLRATLAPLRIGSVQITVRRVAFDVPSGNVGGNDPSQAAGKPLTDPRVDNRPVVIDSKGRLARLNDGELETVEDVEGLAVPGVNRPAVTNDSSSYAVLNADRTRLLLQLPGTKMVSLVHSTGLSAPSFDPQGWVWTASRTHSGYVYAAEADSGAVKVRAPWTKHLDIVSMRMSRDGTRAAIVARYRGVGHLFVAGVLRDQQGRPLSLTAPMPGLFPDLKSVRDVAWVSQDEVVVLGRRAGLAGEGPWVVQIGGAVRFGGSAVSGAESITAGNGEEALMAGTEQGVLMRSGRIWDLISPARWPAFPG